MTKSIVVGQRRALQRRAVGMCRVSIDGIISRVYAKEDMIKVLQAHTTLQPLDSIVNWDLVLEKLISEDRIRVILPEDLPLSAELVCPNPIYLPLGFMTTVNIPENLYTRDEEQRANVYTLSKMIKWFEDGCPTAAGIRQIEPTGDRCTAIIGITQMYSLILKYGVSIFEASKLSGTKYVLPSVGPNINIGWQNIPFSTMVDRFEDVEEPVSITEKVATHVGILRWGLNKSKKTGRYSRVKELLVYWTPDNLKIIKNDAMLQAFFKELLANTEVLKRFTPDKCTVDGVMDKKNGWAFPSDKEYGGMPTRDTALKATFEVAETTSQRNDGYWEYLEYDVDAFLSFYAAAKKGEVTIEEMQEHALTRYSEFGTIDVESVIRVLRRRYSVPSEVSE